MQVDWHLASRQLRPVCLSSTPYESTLLLMPLLRTKFGNQWIHSCRFRAVKERSTFCRSYLGAHDIQVKGDETEENRGTDEGMHRSCAPSHITSIVICRSATRCYVRCCGIPTQYYIIIVIIIWQQVEWSTKWGFWRRKLRILFVEEWRYPIPGSGICHSSGCI
jgi:hypothetical protein